MIDTVYSMATEMRRMRIPVATSDLISAMKSLTVIDLADRESVRESLAACLSKSRDYRDTFDVLFDLYFSDEPLEDGRPLGALDDSALRDLLITGLSHRNRPVLREISAEAVDRYAKIQPGRAVAGTFYIFRTMRALAGDGLTDDVEAVDPTPQPTGATGLVSRAVRTQRADDAVAEFERIVESEVRRRLVAERGADDVAVSLRNPLPEDSDFLTASTEMIDRMSAVIEPLGRTLGRLLLERQRSATARQLDIRATIRDSLSTGGTPVTLRFLPPRPPKPRLVVIADISGSVASFASFALQLTYAVRGHFSSLRSFVFIDGVDEVSDLIAASGAITDTNRRINEERRGVWFDGHSDYGHALSSFAENHLAAVDNRTTILILGDARNNYRDSRSDSLERIQARAANVYWLNPERRVVWDDGDSIMREYAEHCDAVVECRTIRQLEAFISGLA